MPAKKKPGVNRNAAGKKVNVGAGKSKTKTRKVVTAPKSKATPSWSRRWPSGTKPSADSGQKKTIGKKEYKKTYGGKALKAAKAAGRVKKQAVKTTKLKRGKKGNKW